MLIKNSVLSRLSVSTILSVSALLVWQKGILSQDAPCKFAPTSQISSKDQAKCLLRAVGKYGNLGSNLSSLPSPLDRFLSLPMIDLDKEIFKHYLKAHKIREEDIGGSLDEPVSRANANSPNAELARYFIIHDTSTPNFGDRAFPENINDASWNGNKLQQWTREPLLAHIFISRTGESVTPVNFSEAWRSTGYELDICGQACKGLFLSVEMVQPRRSDAKGGTGNDAIAPTPGFTDAQLDRLALVYIAASIRRGKWMIPAFHASIDAGIEGGHDDPQNFDLEHWTERLNKLVEVIKADR